MKVKVVFPPKKYYQTTFRYETPDNISVAQIFTRAQAVSTYLEHSTENLLWEGISSISTAKSLIQTFLKENGYFLL